VRREKQPTFERHREANGPSMTVSGCSTQSEKHTGAGRLRSGTSSRSEKRRYSGSSSRLQPGSLRSRFGVTYAWLGASGARVSPPSERHAIRARSTTPPRGLAAEELSTATRAVAIT
jgi:hypothetical protein